MSNFAPKYRNVILDVGFSLAPRAATLDPRS